MKLIINIILLILLNQVSYAQTEPMAELKTLIEEALKNNPSLFSIKLEKEAAIKKSEQLKYLDPPEAGFEFYQTPIKYFPNPIKNGLETDYYFQQSLPFPGKLKAMSKPARTKAEMTGQRYFSVEKQLIKEIKSTYYDLYFAQKKNDVNEENKELLRNLIEIALKQYEVGKGSQADIIKSQTELSVLSIETVQIQKDIRIAKDRLRKLVGSQTDISIGNIPDIEISFIDMNLDKIESIAVENRPELKEMEFNIKMNEAELAASKKEKLPDFIVRFMYKDMKMAGDDYWSSMFGITIPQAFWSKGRIDSKIEENRINIKKANSDYEDIKKSVLLEVREAYENLQANRDTIDLYKNSILLQTEQNLESTTAAYRSGTVDFQMVIDSAGLFFNTKKEYQETITEYMKSLAGLEQSVGMEIEKINQCPEKR